VGIIIPNSEWCFEMRLYVEVEMRLYVEVEMRLYVQAKHKGLHIRIARHHSSSIRLQGFQRSMGDGS
jgi:hypothetical protein